MHGVKRESKVRIRICEAEPRLYGEPSLCRLMPSQIAVTSRRQLKLIAPGRDPSDERPTHYHRTNMKAVERNGVIYPNCKRAEGT